MRCKKPLDDELRSQIYWMRILANFIGILFVIGLIIGAYFWAIIYLIQLVAIKQAEYANKIRLEIRRCNKDEKKIYYTT